jgi:hypothetical protein
MTVLEAGRMGETIGKKTIRSRKRFFQGVMTRTVALEGAH